MENKRSRCTYCGKPDLVEGGTIILHEHHPQGRKTKNRAALTGYWYCPDCHEIAECRNWLRLPFTEFFIQGKLFDKYAKNGDPIEIEKLIKSGKFTEWR